MSNVNGQFVKGHTPWHKGKTGVYSDKVKKLWSKQRSGKNAWNWSDNPSYQALHNRIKKVFFKPELCMCCGKKAPYDLANISNGYKEDISDWEWLCRGCHQMKDGRLKMMADKIRGVPMKEETKEKLRKANKGQTPWNKGKKNVYSRETIKKMRKAQLRRFQYV